MLHGFSVDYVSMDGASTNRAFTKMLFSGPPMDSLFLARNPLDSSHFIAFNRDIKHCIKKIRNGIESSRETNTLKGKHLLYKDVPIVWEMWQRAFTYNSAHSIRLHHKLTREHIFMTSNLIMRNHLAEDVLSSEMLSLIRAYQKSLHVGSVLDSAVHLLENTSLLVSMFKDCCCPILFHTDKRLERIRSILKFFRE